MPCLICLSQAPADLSQLDNHSYPLFVLRKVLQIPVDQVTLYLKKCPEIDKWFELCTSCNQTVGKCKLWYDQLLQALERFNEFQEVVIATLRQSQKEKFDANGIKQEAFGNEHFVTEAIRQSLFNNDPSRAPMILEIDLRKPQTFSENSLPQNFKRENLAIVHEEPVPNDSEPLIQYISEEEIIIKTECIEAPTDDNFVEEGHEEADNEPTVTLNPKEAPKSRGRPRKIIDGKSGFKCSTCNKIYATANSLHTHEYLHKNAATLPYPCHLCNKRFPRGDYLSYHLRSKHDVINQSLKVKHSDSSDDDDLVEEKAIFQEEDTKDPSWKPNISPKPQFSTLRGRGRGRPRKIISYKNTKGYQCSTCKKLFSTANSLQVHQYLHKNAATLPYRCHLCNKRFPRSDYRYNHLRSKHGVINKLVKRVVHKGYKTVPKVFSDNLVEKTSYETSEENPTNQDPSGTSNRKIETDQKNTQGFKCSICNKQYATASTLANHQYLHKNAATLPYQCNLCNKRFPRGDYLHQHLRTKHGVVNKSSKFARGRKPRDHPKVTKSSEDSRWHCGYCGKSGVSKIYIIDHVEVVHEKKLKKERVPSPLMCKICKEGFPKKLNLHRHLVEKHNILPKGVRKCEEKGCDKVLFDSYVMKVHMAQHKLKPLFKCELCGMDFYYKHHYERHLDVHLTGRKVKKNKKRM